MEPSHVNEEKEEAMERILASYGEITSALPKGRSWLSSADYMCRYQGFWYTTTITIPGVLWAQQHFRARPTDIFLVTSPKCGTTWFKALVFSIVHRTKYSHCNHPLLKNNPHECVPFLELKTFHNQSIQDPEFLPPPRVIGTHMPYTSLPKSIVNSGCKIVYVCRNPKDVFVSLWHFVLKIRENEMEGGFTMEEAFYLFCNGVSPAGPYWEHVLSYWEKSLASPDKISFVKYEEMHENPLEGVKKLANFLGCPFSLEEEEGGVVDEIRELCSFDNMRKLDVNKTGISVRNIRNDSFFREGKVGDWKNHLSSDMIECLDRITEQKFSDTGLTF